jgi:hypothetical protein
MKKLLATLKFVLIFVCVAAMSTNIVFGQDYSLEMWDAAVSLFNQAAEAQQEARYEEALALYEEALAIVQELEEPQAEATILYNLGVIYQDIGRDDEALQAYESARAIYVDLRMDVKAADVDEIIGMMMASSQNYDADLFCTMPWTLAFSPDSRYLVCGGRDGTVSLWQIDAAGTAVGIGRLSEHVDWVTTLAFAPGSAWLATGGLTDGIILFDLDRQWVLRSFQTNGNVHSLVFSLDSELLIGGTSKEVSAWRLSNGHQLITLCDITYCSEGGIGAGAFNLSALPSRQGVLATFVGGQSLSLLVVSPSLWAVFQPDIEWGVEESWSLGEDDTSGGGDDEENKGRSWRVGGVAFGGWLPGGTM